MPTELSPKQQGRGHLRFYTPPLLATVAALSPDSEAAGSAVGQRGTRRVPGLSSNQGEVCGLQCLGWSRPEQGLPASPLLADVDGQHPSDEIQKSDPSFQKHSSAAETGS